MKGLSKNHKNLKYQCFECLVRTEFMNPGPKKLRLVFPHISVLSNPPPIAIWYCFLGGVGWVSLLNPYVTGKLTPTAHLISGAIRSINLPKKDLWEHIF